MLRLTVFSALAAAAVSPLVWAASSQTYTWKNVKIGGGGGRSLLAKYLPWITSDNFAIL